MRKYNKYIVYVGNVCFESWFWFYQIDEELLIVQICVVLYIRLFLLVGQARYFYIGICWQNQGFEFYFWFIQEVVEVYQLKFDWLDGFGYCVVLQIYLGIFYSFRILVSCILLRGIWNGKGFSKVFLRIGFDFYLENRDDREIIIYMCKDIYIQCCLQQYCLYK